MSRDANSEALNRVIRFYESLTPESLMGLSQIYDTDAQFVDPFNDVSGVESISQIFADMFESLESPRFEVLTAFESLQGASVAQPHQAFMTWNFYFHRNGQSTRTIQVHGSTHLVFGNDSKVVIHRDYWDAAGQLYEQMPVLGSILGMLRRKISVRK